MSVGVTYKSYRNHNYCTSTATSDLTYFGKVHINWSPTLYKCMDAERHFDTPLVTHLGACMLSKPKAADQTFTVINTQSTIQKSVTTVR